MNAWAHAVPSGSHRSRIFAPSFRFYSPSGGVEANGCFATLATPAEEDGQALERSVQRALGEARAAG